MTVTTLSSSAISSRAIFGLNQATQDITDSTQRLSTGIRFVNAGDDVGGIAIANRFNSQLVSLRQAQSNNLQADSLLQTAYSAASEINDILTSMRSLAVQGNSGTLTTTERATLDLEFQELKAEVDSITSSTSFNEINLLDGSASDTGEIVGATTNSTQASAIVTFTSAIGAGETIVINGVTFTEGVDGFAAGASADDTASSLASVMQTSTDSDIRNLDVDVNGAAITITGRAGGTQANYILIDDRIANSTGAGSFDVTGGTISVANVYTLSGGQDDGISRGSTFGVGTIGDSLVNTFQQEAANATLTIISNDALETTGEVAFRVDDGNGSLSNFTSDPTPTAGAAEFSVGATADETLKNLVDSIRGLTTGNDFVANQLEYEVRESQLFIRGALTETVTNAHGNAASINESLSADEGGLTGLTLNNNVNTGINTDDVVSSGFIGTISGFSATYNSADNITASITIGTDTFSATIDDTTPAANGFVTFNSTSGGSFAVELASAGGLTVSNQTDADTYASRLDAAFSGITFYQGRTVTSFTGAGQLAGGRAEFTSDAFTDPTINSISVTDSASAGGNAVVEFDIEGETFRTQGLGTSIGAYETVYIRSITDANRSLVITNGGSATVDLSSETAASTFAQTLRTNFGLDATGSGALEFQIGESGSDTLSVSIASTSSDSLFDGETPDLLSQTNSAAAETVIDNAIDELAEIIATIGAAQARLEYSYNANSSIITELDTARGLIEDTDITSESTAYAEAVVQQQAAISVLAQTQLLSSNLLDLLAVGA